MASLCDLCLRPACIPAGHVLQTDQWEEGDVKHADVRSPPHTEQEGRGGEGSVGCGGVCWTASGILKRFASSSLLLLLLSLSLVLLLLGPSTITQLAPSINYLLASISLVATIDLLPFFSMADTRG